MDAAAAEGARLMLTSGDAGAAVCESYVRRRLAAVPALPVFHVGGEEGWQVDVSGPDGDGTVAVEVAGHARPLPLTSAIASALVGGDAEGVRLRVRVEERLRPSWAGGGYDDWVGMWG